MLEQLDTLVIPKCNFIRLRYRYTVNRSVVPVKSLTFLIKIEFNTQPISIYRLLESVKKHVLLDLFYLQHVDVEWNTVSITFPFSKFGTQKDILKLPLTDYRGAVTLPGSEQFDLKVMHIGLRFQGHSLPRTIKIHGICPDDSSVFKLIADRSADVFKSKLEIGDTGAYYKIVFESKEVQSPKKKPMYLKKQEKDIKKKEIKKQIKIIEPSICYWTIQNK